MADNIPHIRLAQNEWTDIYSALAAYGVAIGDPLLIENVGSADVYLAVQAAQPTPEHDAYNVLKKGDPILMGNTASDVGAWAFCNGAEGLLAVSTTSPNGFVRMLKVLLADGYGNPLSSFRGALDVHDSDVHSVAINHYFWRDLATYTLAADVPAQSISASFTSIVGIVVGSDFHFNDAATGAHDHTFATVTAVNPVGNVVTFNRPLDNAYTAASTTVTRISRNMNQVGALGAPVAYRVRPTVGQIWHGVSLSFSITDNDPMDDATFGGLPPLPNGVAVRIHDVTAGTYGTYSFWRKNSDFFLDCFDPKYADKAPSGSYGYRGKLFVKDSYGAIVKLFNTVDQITELEILIQDDLSGLQTFEMTVHGHLEGG